MSATTHPGIPLIGESLDLDAVSLSGSRGVGHARVESLWRVMCLGFGRGRGGVLGGSGWRGAFVRGRVGGR